MLRCFRIIINSFFKVLIIFIEISQIQHRLRTAQGFCFFKIANALLHIRLHILKSLIKKLPQTNQRPHTILLCSFFIIMISHFQVSWHAKTRFIEHSQIIVDIRPQMLVFQGQQFLKTMRIWFLLNIIHNTSQTAVEIPQFIRFFEIISSLNQILTHSISILITFSQIIMRFRVAFPHRILNMFASFLIVLLLNQHQPYIIVSPNTAFLNSFFIPSFRLRGVSFFQIIGQIVHGSRRTLLSSLV